MGPTPWDKKVRTDRLACQQAGVGEIDLGRPSANSKRRLRGFGCDVTVLTQPVQHGLQRFGGMEPAAHPHGTSPGELADLPPLNGTQQILTLLVHRIGTHERVSYLGVFQEVFADPDCVLHSLCGYFHEVQKAMVLRSVEQSGDPQHSPHILASPVGDLRQIGAEAALRILEQLLQNGGGFIGQFDGIFHSVRLQHGTDQLGIFIFDGFPNGLRMEGANTQGGLGHGIEEPGGQSSATKGSVGHQAVQHLRLHCQQHGEGRMEDAFTGSADPVHTDGVTAVAFQEYVDVDVLGVDTVEDIEDTTLGRNDGCLAVIRTE